MPDSIEVVPPAQNGGSLTVRATRVKAGLNLPQKGTGEQADPPTSGI
ncbi:MAG: hypothetical protein IPP46_20085 [Bacteroidetes bacterium]|nr:hypothetical protein [Bacteroidota bacterium]